MRGSKIEQLGLAHRDGFRQFVDIEKDMAAMVAAFRRGLAVFSPRCSPARAFA